jgi:hypothetical protein
MKKPGYVLALLLILGAWPVVSTTQAATVAAVVGWDDNGFGQSSAHGIVTG